MKKILLLGGSAQQVVAIETARRLGYYTVLCDYLVDNPGQYVADKFFLVSTTDKDAVLKIAKGEEISGILAYASDPAAPTAAYVAEKLNLPGNPYHSVEILCNKDLFRDFLKKNNFNTPNAGGYSSVKVAIKDCRDGKYRFPIISKPVDSSGSKGVVKIENMDDLETKLEYSMSFSREGRIVVEEFLDKYGYQVAGDGLSIDGNLVFRCFANDHFDANSINPFVPIAASFPYNMPEWVHSKIHDEIQRLISLLGMGTCTYNFDIRIDKNYNVYLMEVAPRDGGNYIPQIIHYATGVDLVECSVLAALNEKVNYIENCKVNGWWAYYSVHSMANGVLKNINIDPKFAKEHIVEEHLVKRPGDTVTLYTGANSTLGCYLMKFNSMPEMLHMMDHSEEWIKLEIE